MRTKTQAFEMGVRNKGWSLLEVVAGLALLSLIAIQFMVVTLNSTHWTKEAGVKTQASHYAYGILEIIAANKASYLSPSSSNYQIDLHETLVLFPPPEGMEIKAEACPRTDISNLQQVVVKVWRSESDYVEMQTLLAY